MIVAPHIADFKRHVEKLIVLKTLTLILICVILLSFSYLLVTTDFEKEAQASNLSTDNILGLINVERSKAKLTVLKFDPKLVLAADNKARDMGIKSYFDHYSPTGKRGLSFIADTGLKYQTAGENLAVLFSDSQDLVTSWMNSATHKKNILNPNFQLTGIGLYTGTFEGYQTTFIVQFFADSYLPVKPVAKKAQPQSKPVSIPVKEEPKPVVVKEPTEEEKQAILKQEQDKQFNDNFEKTKQQNTLDIQSAVRNLFGEGE